MDNSVVELVELNNSNQLIGTHQPHASQLPLNQIGQAHLYQQQTHLHQQSPQNLRHVNNPKMVKHRELPVDVPDSFVGVAKQSPRYPPPKPHRQISPPMPIDSHTPFDHAVTAAPYSCVKTSSSNNSSQQVANPTAAKNVTTASNIQTHNSSLRSSIKLKQLEKSRNGQGSDVPIGQMHSAVNQAFELNEDEGLPSNQLKNHQGANLNNRQQQLESISSPSTPDLLSIHSRLQHSLNGEFAEVSGDARLAKLLNIYDTIVQTHNRQFKIPPLTSRHETTTNSLGELQPVVYKVSDLLQSAIYMLNREEMTTDAAELQAILCKHEMDGVCSAFDRIAQSFEFAQLLRPMTPQATELAPENSIQRPSSCQQKLIVEQVRNHQLINYDYRPDQLHMNIENNMYQQDLFPLTEVDSNENSCTKTIRIEKSSTQALGATIRNFEDKVIVGRIVCGGAAHMSGLLHEGDEILEVNGVQMRGKNINEVVSILESMNGTLNFTILAGNYNKPVQRMQPGKIFVRAFFRYEAANDLLIPCRDLGLSFDKGDILAIIDQTDPGWWQAHKEGDSEWRLPGLIPSVNLQKRREKESGSEGFDADYLKHDRKNLVSLLFNCPKGSSARRRKKFPHVPLGPDEIPFYEEVSMYYPDKYRKRPIILVGPKLIGQREIVAKLLQDSTRFASAISHTSKPMQEGERNGVDFHFVTRAQFEADIKAGKFIECGQYQNQYYGTSLDAMKEVVRSKKTCIHLVNTTSIFNFRNGRAGSELKPFFVFVKPDDSHPEKLKNIVSSFSIPKSNLEDNIRAIMAEVQLIETHYLPYFDLVLTVSDVEHAYQNLLYEIEKIETEPQWIPTFWQETPPS